MDVRLSPEQRQLRDSAARVASRLGVRTVSDLDDRERAAKLDQTLARAGWRELRAPDDTGEPLASAVEVALVAEQLARALADTAFLGPTLASELRRLAGLTQTTFLETVTLTRDLHAPATVGDEAVAIETFDAVAALVLVDEGRGRSVASVEAGGRGSGVDLTRPVARVETSSATEIPGARMLIDDHALARWTALGLALACADLVGTMQGAIDLAVDYAKHRRQFARSIGSFQAVQHLLADTVVHLEGSRSAALYCAWGVDALDPFDALGHAASAKAYCARAARVVCETVIQVHGGIGNTWDCLAHVYLRRALLSIDLLGGVGTSLTRVLEHAGVVPG